MGFADTAIICQACITSVRTRGKKREKTLVKKYAILIFIAALLLVCLAWCWREPIEKLDVPDTDIIYQAIDRHIPGEDYSNAIGFVNADGTNNTVIKTRKRAVQPTSSESGKIIYLRIPMYFPNEIWPNWGRLVLWNIENGKAVNCPKEWMYSSMAFPIKGSDDFLIYNSPKVYRIVSSSCEIVKEVTTIPSNSEKDIPSTIYPSWQGTHIAYSVGRIRILDINTGELRYTGEWGDYPTFSPDGRQIAFITKVSLPSIWRGEEQTDDHISPNSETRYTACAILVTGRRLAAVSQM
jgi:hypothetical protein